MKLLIFPPIDNERLVKVKAVSKQLEVVNAQDESHARREITDADAFFGKLTPELLKEARHLQWVQAPTASLEHYVFPELVSHSCVLTNMRGLFSDVIADHVMSYVLCLARNLHRYIRQQIQHHWEPIGGEASRTTFAAGPGQVSDIDRAHLHVSDCTLGIVGFGGIGQEVGRRASSFGMRVLAVDPVEKPAPAGVEAVWPMNLLPDLLQASDFVVIAAPHTPQTEGMFRREQFQQMKPSAYLINIGRGAIVSLKDLTDALRAKEIAGAALDVFEVEPLPADHPLWDMENVIITPHVAAASVHIAERHLQVLLDNIARFVSGKPLDNVASKTDWF